jgi:hypothetical protein
MRGNGPVLNPIRTAGSSPSAIWLYSFQEATFAGAWTQIGSPAAGSMPSSLAKNSRRGGLSGNCLENKPPLYSAPLERLYRNFILAPDIPSPLTKGRRSRPAHLCINLRKTGCLRRQMRGYNKKNKLTCFLAGPLTPSLSPPLLGGKGENRDFQFFLVNVPS